MVILFINSKELLENLILAIGDQFRKIIKRYKKVGYNLDVMRQSTCLVLKIVSGYDKEIPQSQTADKPMAPRGRATQQSRDTRKTNYAKQQALSSPSR